AVRVVNDRAGQQADRVGDRRQRLARLQRNKAGVAGALDGRLQPTGFTRKLVAKIQAGRKQSIRDGHCAEREQVAFLAARSRRVPEAELKSAGAAERCAVALET